MAFFARFTERAQRALLAAQKEAAAMHRNYVGTEHLLLGIMRDPGKAGLILNAVSEEALRATIVQMVGEGDEQTAGKTMSYAPRTKKVLEQSAREARDLGQNYVGISCWRCCLNARAWRRRRSCGWGLIWRRRDRSFCRPAAAKRTAPRPRKARRPQSINTRAI